MRRPATTVLLALALALVTEQSAAVVGIRGAVSCGTWLKGRGAGESNRHQTWLVAFLSGLAAGRDMDFWGQPGVNILENESVYLWMDNYCRNNPLKDMDDGAESLFWERIRMNRK